MKGNGEDKHVCTPFVLVFRSEYFKHKAVRLRFGEKRLNESFFVSLSSRFASAIRTLDTCRVDRYSYFKLSLRLALAFDQAGAIERKDWHRKESRPSSPLLSLSRRRFHIHNPKHNASYGFTFFIKLAESSLWPAAICFYSV